MKKAFKIIFPTLFIVLLFSCSNRKNTSGDAKNYDNIIAEIKKMELPLGKLVKYRIETFSDISTIYKPSANFFSERGKGEGNICVLKTKENLLIFIETDDHGHAGEYGVAYSENGQTPVWNDDDGEFWTVDEKINGHWWKISFRLG